jgi:glycosyltransferase involved in cell wall biosynthesis
MRPVVSAVVIALNAGPTIGRALASVCGLVNELVVAVDSRTTDRTREIALEAGARVVALEWRDSFAEARNEAMGHATGEWILMLDADEHIPASERGALYKLLARPRGAGPAVYEFLQVNRIGGAICTVGTIRLFERRPDLAYCYRAHEQILPAALTAGLPIRRTGIRIDHDGYINPDLARGKLIRNRRLLEMDLADHPADPFVRDNLNRTVAELERAGRIHCLVP